jgi:hypothetical protein
MLQLADFGACKDETPQAEARATGFDRKHSALLRILKALHACVCEISTEHT